METKPPHEFIGTERPPDYHQKILALFAERGLEISTKTLEIAASQLYSLREKYHDHNYHNDVHSFDDLERSLAILDILKKYIDITPKEYELLTIASVFHDDTIANTPGSTLTAEQQSAYQAITVTDFDSSDSLRLMELIMVTEVQYDQNGVHQTNFINENNDVLKFALGFADIGATLMEGRGRMIQDVVNLALEQYKKQPVGTTTNNLVSFMSMQRGFVDERIHDLEAGIIHYFSPFGDDVVRQITADIHTYITPSLQDLQPLLAQFDTKLPNIQHQLSIELKMNELKAKPDCSASIQQKLKMILGDIPL